MSTPYGDATRKVYTTRCRGEECERTVKPSFPMEVLSKNNRGISVACAGCGTTNWIDFQQTPEVKGE